MTNKDKIQSPASTTNPAQLLLSRYKKVEDIIERSREENRKIGLPESFQRFYIDYNPGVGRYRKYQQWLDAVTNQNGQFNTMLMLKSIKAVKNEESPHLDNVSYPRRELHNIHRIKTRDGQEVLQSGEMWYGLGIDGKERSVWVEDLQTYCEPIVESIPIDPQIRIGYLDDPQTRDNRQYQALVAKNVKLLRVSNYDPMFTANERGNLIHTTPFSREAVEDLIRDSKPKGAFDDKYNGTMLSLKRGGVIQTYPVNDLDTFCAPFDELWTRLSAPAHQVDLEALANKLKSGIDINAVSQIFELAKEAGIRTSDTNKEDKDKQARDQYR
jgi:hypothetical protein